jgi:hypothetical protein
MNNIFNIKRFGLVLRKDIMEGWKRYTLMFVTMLGIIAIMLIGNYWDYYNDFEKFGNQQRPINTNISISLSVLLGVFGIVFASTFMSPMNSKLKKINYLANPSSHLEKYLTRWLIITVGYIISFFVALWVADALRVAICSARFSELEVTFVDLSKLIKTEDSLDSREYVFQQSVFMLIVSLYLLFQSLFILGSTFWEKLSFVKTFTAITLIIISYVLICRWAILFSYGGFEGFGNVLDSFLSDRQNDFDEKDTLLFISSIISVFTLSLWSLAFFRFRESAIINKI